MPFVNYQIEMTPENAPVIDQINRILLADSYTATAPAAKAETKAPDKPAAKAAPAKAPAKVADDNTVSLVDFKTVVKAAKADHGEEFCKTVLESQGAKEGPLGQMVSAIDADDYGDVISTLETGPAEKTEEPEEDDGFDDEEADTSEVDAEAVKTAAKAYAKEVGRDEAKQIMNGNGAATLTKITDCSQKQLQAMFKAFTA